MTPSRKINYLEALWRRKWLVLPFVILGAAAGFGAFTQMTPLYRASAVISHVPQTLSSSIMPDPADSRRAAPNRVLEMRSYIDHVDFLGRVAAQAGIENLPRDEMLEIRERFQIIKLNLENYRFTYVDRDPVRAADMANIFAAVFVDTYHEEKLGKTKSSIGFVEDEIGRLEAQLATKQARLSAYRDEHKGALPTDRAANQAELVFLRTSIADLDRELERVGQERDKRREMLRTNSRDIGGSTDTGTQDPRAVRLADLRQKLADAQLRYTDSHPEVVRLKANINALVQRIRSEPFSAVDAPPAPLPGPGESPGSESDDAFRAYIESELTSLDARLEELQSEKDAAQRRVVEVDRLVGSSLTHQVEIEKYNAEITVVRNRLTRSQNQLQQLQSELEVVDRAMYEHYALRASAGVPLLPFRPDIFQLTLIGLLGGLAAGVGLALLRELSDKRIYSSEEIESLLDVEIMANVESFQASRRRKDARSSGGSGARAAHG